MGKASQQVEEAPLRDGAAEPRATPLVNFQRRRKRDSRDRLLAAAMTMFCERGYLPVSVEDIATAAGVSRMTFYRHFSGKADLAAVLFETTAGAAMPALLRIASMAWETRPVVIDWITGLFERDRENRRLLRAFTQATADEGDFTERAQQFIGGLVSRLGESVPAFAVDPGRPPERRRWLEAWLLLYEILDQSNHAALASGVAADPLVIEILADRFLAFVVITKGS